MLVVVNKKKFYRFMLITIAVIAFVVLALPSVGLKPIFKLFFPLNYSEQVQKYSMQNHVDPLLVYSVIKAESNFKVNANSNKGAKGLMQITDDTAKWCAGKMGLNNFDLQKINVPDININIGCWYISYLLKNSEGRLINALAAYNAGNSNVNQWLEQHGSENLDAEKIPFPETRNYVKKVIYNYKMYKALYE